MKSSKTKNTSKKVRCAARPVADLFLKEFKDESDRAAAIVGAAFLDVTLEGILKRYLVKNSRKREDPLFDGPTAPLGSFSSKIHLAFRLGLISEDLSEALRVIKKIRNIFAHDLTHRNFKSQQVVTLIHDLKRIVFKRKKRLQRKMEGAFPGEARGDFQMSLLFILWWFWCGAFQRHLKRLVKRKFEL